MKSLPTGALPTIVLSLGLIFVTPPVAAIYKCEQGNIVTYTDMPCEGQQLSVTLPRPSREAEDKSLSRESKEVARLQALREQRERQDKQIRDLSARGAAAREKKCKSLALQLKWREEDVRDAPVGSQDKARKMARRAAEKYRNDCQ